MPSRLSVIIVQGFVGLFTEYRTPKIVTIRSVKVGLLHRFVQVAIIGYIVGYAILYKRGYQETDIGQSTVVTKVKGMSSTLNRRDLPEQYKRIWDTPDYVVPPMMLLQLKDSVFIMTNAIITPRQQIVECAEDPEMNPESICTSNTQCRKGYRQKFGNGEMTGYCVRWNNTTNYTCQIKGWCPVENDKLKKEFLRPLIRDVRDFTMLVKNTVEFPKFNAKKRNVDLVKDPNYLKKCTYHEKNDTICPILAFRDVIAYSKSNISHLLTFGEVINIAIYWDCNLDKSIDFCQPTYKFSQMDSSNSNVSPGYNFRHAYYYRDDKGILSRDLIKAFGILFVFNVQAEAGKFSFAKLALNIGAGLALLGLVTIYSQGVS